MKRTDDFLADLETQLGAAAAAGALPPRRRRPSLKVLRPAMAFAVTAAAVTAFVLAAESGTDPERAAEPPVQQQRGGPFPLEMANRGTCALDPQRAEPPHLSVLKRPADGKALSDSPYARTARADVPVTVVPMASIAGCVTDDSRGPGICVVVDLAGRRSACWPIDEVEAGRAATGLGGGSLVAVLPDRFEEVTFVIGEERDTYRVTDNVVIGHLEGAKEGASVELLPGTAPRAGCGKGVAEAGPLSEPLLVALPILRAQPATAPPDALADRLAKGGARRMWLGEARRHEGDGTSEAWVVPVADSRFAECGDPLIDAPLAFEGPGACLAIMHAGELRAARCATLADLTGITTAAVSGGRVAAAFLPHGAHSVGFERTHLRDMDPPWGVVFGPVPDGEALSFTFVGPDGPLDPGDLPSRTVAVLAPDEELAAEARARLQRAGVQRIEVATAPAPDRSRVMYAAGMASAAGQVAELMRVESATPLDLDAERRAGPQADIVVLTGDDLRP